MNDFNIENISLSSRNSEVEVEIVKIKKENKILSDKFKSILGKVVATRLLQLLKKIFKRSV